MPAGRPTVMTIETVNKLEEGFAMGFTDEEACLYANISKQTLYDYCKTHPEYTDRKEGLKNHPKILAKTNVYKALKDNNKVDDSKWYLERRDKDFKIKSDITTDDKPISILANVIPSNDSHEENNENEAENQGSAGGDIGEQDSINPSILDSSGSN